MRRALPVLVLAALPGWPAAEIVTSGQASLDLGAFTAGPDSLARLHGDAMARIGTSGLQVSATFGTLAGDDTLTDLRIIAFQDIGARWRYGAEVQTTTDTALGGADYAMGFRLRYSDAGGTVDTRLSIAQNGTDGAFSVTVAMAEDLGPGAEVHGLLHRFSTNTETGDFFAVGLGGSTDLRDGWQAYGDGLWSLSDDFSTETVTGTIGLRRGPYHAGLSAWQTNGTSALGLTAGITIPLGAPDDLFVTDPWGLQMAQIGH